ncbi:V-type ATP synthase subunit E [Clostridium aestuarii]|uniref:V-type proton ATPase subunit E n=1 Tax=Clostridium aestuarii TaxID=338193 RepID=A0ABT4D091_9CLOT|nr:V-type ATP synthase subunit E [Clostridium aestuarii]MCY6484661.1 V-type ATP synthase subunit E [Clostridium aestuarii]
MSSINNLTSKIIEDANNTYKQLIEDAKSKEKDLINKRILEAEKEKKSIISKAESEAKTKAERIISNAELQVRNMKLDAKQQMLDKVFQIALEKLSEFSQKDTLKFIRESILLLDIDGDEELIIGENCNEVTPEFISELNKALKAQGKLGILKLSSERRNIKGGYILSKNGIEINNTFEALTMSLRDELESEVASALFS